MNPRPPRCSSIAPPPGGDKLPPIEFKREYLENGVTVQDILNDPDTPNQLAGTIASYYDQAIGDTIETFLQPQGATKVTPGPVIPVNTREEGHKAPFDLATLIAAEATGLVDFWYVVKDKAGNPRSADKSTLRMLIVGAPDQLIAPRVPLFSDDDIVNEADARTPIVVEVPEFANAAVGDIIVVDLGGYTIPLPPLQSADIPADPAKPDPGNAIRTVEIPYAILSGIMPTGQPVFSMQVSYQVKRGTFALDSAELQVDCDLTLPGGPDIDPETPVHDNLKPLVVTHAGAGATPNLIPVGYTAPVTATIPHLAMDGKTEVFVTGDKVQVYRKGLDGVEIEVAGEVTIAAADVGKDLIVTVPDDEGSDDDVEPGHWDFYYRVGRPLDAPNDGLDNWALSPTQEVIVADAGDQPGGPNLLPVAICREATEKQGFPALGWILGQDGTFLRVYNYQNMAVGDVIRLTWQGNDALRGTGKDIPGATLDLSHTVTAGDLEDKNDALPGEPISKKKFVEFTIARAELEKITPANKPDTKAYGSAWFTYTVTATSGASNTSETDRGQFKPLVIDARVP
jgi:hypothetical protein